MFTITIKMLGRRNPRVMVCHSAAQAAGFIGRTATLWGVSRLALDWSVSR